MMSSSNSARKSLQLNTNASPRVPVNRNSVLVKSSPLGDVQIDNSFSGKKQRKTNFI